MVNYAISLIHPGERLTLRNVITHTHLSYTSAQEVRKTFTGEEGIITRKQLAHCHGSWQESFFFFQCSFWPEKNTTDYEEGVTHAVYTEAGQSLSAALFYYLKYWKLQFNRNTKCLPLFKVLSREQH